RPRRARPLHASGARDSADGAARAPRPPDPPAVRRRHDARSCRQAVTNAGRRPPAAAGARRAYATGARDAATKGVPLAAVGRSFQGRRDMMAPVFAPTLLKDKVALVTGGGTGICRGIALAFAEHGCHVAVTSRKIDHLEPTKAELRAGGGPARAHAGDAR